MSIHLSDCNCDRCLLRMMQALSSEERQRGWEAWYKRDAPRLLAYLERRCRACRCPDATEDVLHESFVIGFRNIAGGRYVEQGVPLCGYLYGIAKNLLSEIMRLQRREAVAPDEIEHEIDKTPCLDDVIIVQELRLLVQEAHARQSALHQHVVHALYREGKSSENLAEELGKTAGNTRIIAHRAVAEMGKYLKRQHRLLISPRAIRALVEAT